MKECTQLKQARRERKNKKCTLSGSGPQSDVPLDNRRFTSASCIYFFSFLALVVLGIALRKGT